MTCSTAAIFPQILYKHETQDIFNYAHIFMKLIVHVTSSLCPQTETKHTSAKRLMSDYEVRRGGRTQGARLCKFRMYICKGGVAMTHTGAQTTECDSACASAREEWPMRHGRGERRTGTNRRSGRCAGACSLITCSLLTFLNLLAIVRCWFQGRIQLRGKGSPAA